LARVGKTPPYFSCIFVCEYRALPRTLKEILFSLSEIVSIREIAVSSQDVSIPSILMLLILQIFLAFGSLF
jgi:hypothetical protein